MVMRSMSGVIRLLSSNLAYLVAERWLNVTLL